MKNKPTLFLIFISLCFFCVVASAKITLKNRITGINDPLLTGVTKQLNAKIQEIELPLTAAKIKLFYQTAPKEVEKFLQAQGYFKSQVKAQLTHDGDKWIATYQVNCGAPLRITQLEFRVNGGEDNPELQQALRSFPLKSGDVFQTETYNTAKQFLFNCAAQFGYLAAILTKKEVAIDLKKYTARITLDFSFGPRYKFGTINFSPTPFSHSFLMRFLSFQPGEWYSSNQVKNLQESFNNSNFFEEVAVTPDIAHSTKDKVVPIVANLKPRKAHQYNFGMGFGSDTGVRGLLGLELRHITANGQSFKGFAKLSEVQNSFEAHYLIPGKNPVTEQYDLSSALETQNQNYGSSHTLKVAGGYITTWHSWQETLKLSFVKENYNLTDQPIYHADLLVPSINILRSTTDNPINPSRGYSLNFSVQGSSDAVLSTTNFLQAQGNIKYLTSLSVSDQLVLRGTLGITAIHDLDKLPLSFQYFAGGTQSVRGYGYKSIGPGRYLAVGSVELRHKIFGDWYGTVFMDAGNASERFFPDLKKGAGVGVLYNSPIGPIQVSYAKALDLPGTPSRVQFNIGPEF